MFRIVAHIQDCLCQLLSNVTKPVLWIHSVTLCAASALSLYYVITFLLFFVVMHYLVFNSLYTIFLCILQLTRGIRYWSFGSVGCALPVFG
jgi:hypothetical protein